MLIFLIAIILLIGIVFLFTQKEIAIKNKIFIILYLLIIVILAVMYENMTRKSSDSKREIIINYKQGKTLICGDYEVNSKTFEYSSSTLTFISKETKLKDVIISIDDCNGHL